MITAEHRGGSEGGLSTRAVSTAYDDMLESVERTTMYSPKQPYLPVITPAGLLEGDRRVQQQKDPEEIQHITIVGHDAIKFGSEAPTILRGVRAAELLGLIVLVREVVKPEVYKKMGFFPQALTNGSRNSATTQILGEFAGITTALGTPLVTRVGKGTNGKAGMDSFTVSDIRHTTGYKDARRAASFVAFKAYLEEGGPNPGLFEQPSIEAARMALRDFWGSGMTNEQAQRFRDLSRDTAALLSHRTEEYDEQNAMDARAAYGRSIIAHSFEPEWHNDAACSPELQYLFFPPWYFERKDEKIQREKKAKEICRTCPIQADCLSEALERNEPNGIWGGTNEKERKAIRTRRSS